MSRINGHVIREASERDRRSLPTRRGFLWRAQFWTDHTHPQGYGYGIYYKWLWAWTYIGAMRKAERLRHRRWGCAVARWR